MPRRLALVRRALALRLGLGLGVSLGAAPALAGNEDELLLGNDAALSAGAVTATVGDGSALYYNPAGLARVEQNSVDVTASAFVVRQYALPALLSASTGERARGDFTEIVSAPTALSYVRRLTPRLAAGVGVFVSRSMDLVLRSTLPLAAGGRRAEWLAALGVTESRYLATFGVGYRARPGLGIGLSLHGVYDAGFVSSLLAGGFIASAAPGAAAASEAFASDGFLQQQVIFNQINIGFQPGLGLQLDASDHLRLGLSVRGPGLAVFSSERATSGTSQASPELDVFMPVDERSSHWRLEQMLALRAAAAVAYLWAGHWMALDVDYQSGVHSAALDLDRPPVVNARIGARFQLGDALAIGGGLFTDRSNERHPQGYPETHLDFYGGTAGFELSHAYALAAGQGSSTLSFASTLALRYARGTGQVGGVRIDLSAPGEFAGVSTPPNSVGVHELSLHVGSSVYF